MSVDVLDHLAVSRLGSLTYDPGTSADAVERILKSLQQFNLNLDVSSRSCLLAGHDSSDELAPPDTIVGYDVAFKQNTSEGTKTGSFDCKRRSALSGFLEDVEAGSEITAAEQTLLRLHDDWNQTVEKNSRARLSDVDSKLCEIEANSPKSIPSTSTLPSPPELSLDNVVDDLEKMKRLRNRERAARLAELQVKLDAVALPSNGFYENTNIHGDGFSDSTFPPTSSSVLGKSSDASTTAHLHGGSTRRLKRPSSTDRELAPLGSSVQSGSISSAGGSTGPSERIIAHPGNSRSSSSEPPSVFVGSANALSRRHSGQSGSRKSPSPSLVNSNTAVGASAAPPLILGKRNSVSGSDGEFIVDTMKEHQLPAIDEKLIGASNSPGSNAAVISDFKFVLPSARVPECEPLQKVPVSKALENCPSQDASTPMANIHLITLVDGLVKSLRSVHPLDDARLPALDGLTRLLYCCLDLVEQLSEISNQLRSNVNGQVASVGAILAGVVASSRYQALATFDGFFTGSISPKDAVFGLESVVVSLDQHLGGANTISKLYDSQSITPETSGRNEIIDQKPMMIPNSISSTAEAPKNELIKVFDRMLTVYDQYEAELATFTKSPDSKVKFIRMELKKNINTIINTLCSNRLDYPEDKLNLLKSILRGAKCGTSFRAVSVVDHPLALDYCLHLFASQVVSQAEVVVSSHLESAFPLAWVALGLISEFPKLLTILLSCLYKACPYLFPFFPPVGQLSEFEAKKRIGYRVDQEGTMEETGIFLNRLSGYVGLFGALLVCPVPVSQRFRSSNSPFRLDRTGKANPFGLGMAWRLLHNLVDLKPLKDVSATVIHGILMVSGFAMMDAYKSSFRKLVDLIRVLYLPEIETVSGGGGEASFIRLQTLLLEKTYLKQPPGYIS